MWTFLQAYNGALSVIGTLIVAVLTSLSVFISMKTLREMKQTREEENRPYIIAYLSKEPRDICFELCLKNFGKTAAKIDYLELEPQLNTYSGKLINDVFKDTVLMPNQKIHTLFMKDNQYDVKKIDSIHVKCQYSLLDNNKKSYCEEYSLNYEYTKEFAYVGDTTTSGQTVSENALTNIAKALDIIRRQN